MHIPSGGRAAGAATRIGQDGQVMGKDVGDQNDLISTAGEPGPVSPHCGAPGPASIRGRSQA